MKKEKYIRFLLIIIMTIGSLFAEDAEKSRAGQVTFFYPMGSSGVQSLEYSNSFSLNLVYGMNGGVDAFEFGGVGNFNTHDVRGTQIAGISNINMEETRGIQFAGVLNTNFGDTIGLIWSGTLNSVFGNVTGVMVSQINVTMGEMKGLQIGLVNYAARSKGMQIGLINVAAEGSESLPIGLINIVKGGYFAIETYVSDTLYGNVSYKMGVERFYTIFKIGGSVLDGDSLMKGESYEDQKYIFSYGLGWGSLIPLSGSNSLAVEISCNPIVYDGNWDSDTNLLNKLDINYHMGLGKHISLFAGPSLNVYVTEETMEDGETGTLPVPYTFFDEEYGDINVSMWVGANLGLTYSF